METDEGIILHAISAGNLRHSSLAVALRISDEEVYRLIDNLRADGKVTQSKEGLLMVTENEL